MNIHEVTYGGYRQGKFIFHTSSNQLVTLFPNEVCPLIIEYQIISLMNKCVGHKFMVGVYPVTEGYFVKERLKSGKIYYDIYEGDTNMFTGMTVDAKEDIPKDINGKKVHVVGKKIVLQKL